MAEGINRALQTRPPDGRSHCSARTLAAATGISQPTVHRRLQAFSLQPQRQKHCRLSTDPFFVARVRDLVGLDLNPPDKAMLPCVDERTSIQALNSTLPLLSMGLKHGEGVTRRPGRGDRCGDHPVQAPARQLRRRQGADRRKRAGRGVLKQDEGPVSLDGEGGFHSGEASATLFADLRHGTPGVQAAETQSPQAPPWRPARSR